MTSPTKSKKPKWINPNTLPMTGWPPGLMQDDSRDLSRWLATRPDSRYQITYHRVGRPDSVSPEQWDSLTDENRRRIAIAVRMIDLRVKELSDD